MMHHHDSKQVVEGACNSTIACLQKLATCKSKLFKRTNCALGLAQLKSPLDVHLLMALTAADKLACSRIF
jgi:hypothetical protein